MLSLLRRMPWLIAVFMFVLVIVVWTTFYFLAQDVPMQGTDYNGDPLPPKTSSVETVD